MTWVIVAIVLVIGGVSAYLSHKDDGPVEQIAESIIESELNLPKGTIDLTPNSKQCIKAVP